MYIGFASPRADRAGDHRLPDARRAAAAGHGRRAWPRPRSWAARPSPCGSGSTRRGWRRAASRPGEVGAAIRGQQLPVGARPGQGLLHGRQHHRRHRPHQPRRVPRHGGQGRERRPSCACGDIATVDLGAQSSDTSVMMNGQRAVFIGVNATPDRQPADDRQGRARAGARRSSAACRRRCQMEVVYDFDRVHQRLDRRGAATRWSRRWRSSSS